METEALEGESEPLNCAICDVALDNMSPSLRQEHYELHFQDAESHQEAVPSSPNTTPSDAPSKEQFWTISLAPQRKPPSNVTPGLIPILRQALLRSHANGKTQRAALCKDSICHIASEFLDTTYGCGYRNYMMACSLLYEQDIIPQYRHNLDQDGGPSIRQLQRLIEMAWSDGYDLVGATQLKNRLVNTKKWIGTADLYTAFTYRGIPSRLVDFPQSGADPEVLPRWVANYFFPPKSTGNIQSALSGASPVVQTEKAPLILQHQGHSRTVVGIETNKAGILNLLVFDPAKKIPSNLRKQALSAFPSPQSPSHSHLRSIASTLKGSGKRPREEDEEDDRHNKKGRPSFVHIHDNQSKEEIDYIAVLKLFRVPLSNLKKRDKYQILTFPLEPILTQDERESRKVVTSEKVF